MVCVRAINSRILQWGFKNCAQISREFRANRSPSECLMSSEHLYKIESVQEIVHKFMFGWASFVCATKRVFTNLVLLCIMSQTSSWESLQIVPVIELCNSVSALVMMMCQIDNLHTYVLELIDAAANHSPSTRRAVLAPIYFIVPRNITGKSLSWI